LEAEGSGEASSDTGVGRSGVFMVVGMRFHNLGKAGQRMVGFPMVFHKVHGGGMWGGEGMWVSLFLCVPCCLVVVPLVPEVVFLVMVMLPPTMGLVGYMIG
jgi:hypothetical protein